MYKRSFGYKYIALTLDDVKEVFDNPLISFVLYGSVARGDDEYSDIDILLILDTNVNYSECCHILGKVLAKLYEDNLALKMMELGYNVL